jgi:hypothetical protein
VVRKALETGSVESLCDRLDYLHAYGDNARWETNVKLTVFEKDGVLEEVGITFFPNKPLKMYGGLNHCESTNKWTVNT